MDFYTRKAKVAIDLKNFLRRREEGHHELTWQSFKQEMAISYGVTEKMLKETLQMIEPRLAIIDNELSKKPEAEDG